MKKFEVKKKTTASRWNLVDHENVNPGLDAFINADMLAKDDLRHGCRWKVLNAHFGNDRIGALQLICMFLSHQQPLH